MESVKAQCHSPVLVEEILSVFSNSSKSDLTFLDGTFGRGGHSKALLKTFPESRVWAIDRDKEAITYGNKHLVSLFKGRLKLLHADFHDLPIKSPFACLKFDGILMDLGVSSPQLDQAERGFSFYRKGPLDMRMDKSQSLKASDIINDSSKEELIRLFQSYGEIAKPYRVVEDILHKRKRKRIERTDELASLILKNSSVWKGKKIHPATAYFLALRICINKELENLKAGLVVCQNLLRPEGKLIVISFHSLEDRIVKHTFKEFVKVGQGFLWNKKIIRPSLEERRTNPRSRSAGLRVFVKTA